MGFFESVVSSTGNLLRGLLLLIILSICVYILVTAIVEKIFPAVQDMGLEGDVLKLSFRGKTMNVVNVPACQLYTPSGVTLSKKSVIKISASGLISTCATGDFSSKTMGNKVNETESRILDIELNRDVHRDWRNANGELVNRKSKYQNVEEGCLARKSKPLKLDPEVEYGYLLAFIVTNDLKNRDIDEILAKRQIKLFRIGKKSEIEYEQVV